MSDPTDPTRDLLRRAYRVDSDFDVTVGLLDVLRRAEAPPVEIVRDRRPAGPPRFRHRRTLSVLAVFAAAILVIFGAVAVLSPGGGGGDDLPGGGGPEPAAFPSQCAAVWQLTLRGREFDVTERHSGCPALSVDRLYLLDAAQGNGVIEKGFATVWPVTPTGVTTGTVAAPFTFVADGWPGPIAGHTYEIWYARQGQTARPGDDALVLYEGAHVLSFGVSGP